MKILKILLILIAAIAGVLVIVTFFLPNKFEVERSIEIKANPAIVFDQINDFRNFVEWSPWSEFDPHQEVKFEGPQRGVGAIYHWKSDSMMLGEGKMEIVESRPNKYVKYHLFYDYDSTGYPEFVLEQQNGSTKVTWKMAGELGFIQRWMKGMMENMLIEQYEDGLKSLKRVSEEKAEWPWPISVEYKKEQYVLAVADSAKIMNSSEKISKAYDELAEFFEKNNLKPIGNPLTITKSHVGDFWSFYAATPIKNQDVQTEGRIEVVKIPGSKVVKLVYTGPYDEMGAAYASIERFMAKNKLKPSGNNWEVYMNDPGSTPPEKLETHIYYPVK